MSNKSPLDRFTRAAGARFADVGGFELPADYGNISAEYRHAIEGAAVFDVSARGKLELTGPEAPNFVHNLSTNDVLNLPLGGGCETFFTTSTAKVITHALVFHLRLGGGREALWLDVAPGQADRLLAHLNHYLIAEQVEMADRTAEFAQMHLAGPASRSVLERCCDSPIPDLELLQHMERTIGATATCSIRRNDPLGVPGYDIVCLASCAGEVWEALRRAGAAPAGLTVYELLRIETGTPEFGKDIDDRRFVVEVGRAHAICFTKGCFLGQEPIVMARDRAGHVNRSFRGLRLSDGPALPSGTKLFEPAGKEVGIVTSSVVSPRFGPIALGYVRRGFEAPGAKLAADAAGGRAVEVVALPFT